MQATTNKKYISANDLLLDSFKLARLIYNSSFSPTLIAGVWRGGTPIAIAVHEYFAFKGIEVEHTAIKAASYYGVNQQERQVSLDGLDHLMSLITPDTQLLLIDDVFDTGRSFDAIVNYIKHAGNQPPKDIKLAAPWYKPTKNLTQIRPDYVLHTTEDWLVFPHELCGLNLAELKNNKPEIANIIEK